MEQSFQHNLQQKQVQSLSPRMLQSLNILQAPAIDLHELIQEELRTNPTLEETDPLADMPTSPIDPDAEKKHQFVLDSLTTKESLREHLLQQAALADADEQTHKALDYLIDTLDEKGRLSETPEDVARETQCPVEKVHSAIGLLQSFDPVGVGARDLRETLLLQLKDRKRENSLASQILEDHFDLLVRRKISDLAKALGRSFDDIEAAVAEIGTLDPDPARNFSTDSNRSIEADIFLSKDPESGDALIELNKQHLPRLRVSDTYTALIAKGKLSRDEYQYLRQQINSANDLISTLAQRQATLLKVATAIIHAQPDFLDHGLAHLRPLTMAQIAEVTGLHETTVSRAVANKYIKTPQGIYELRSLFATGFSTEDNKDALASTSIKEMIGDLIAYEYPAKPLSDQDLVGKLAEKGIKIARRTVAKYRESLQIPPSHQRAR